MPMQVRFSNAPRLQVRVVALPSTGEALTKVDDTNVTLTLGGTPTTALLRATSVTVGWTGTLAPARGGAGTGTFATNTIILGGTTGTGTFQQVASGSSGTVLTSQGAGILPIWAAVASGSFTAGPVLKVDDTNVTVAWSGASATAVNGTTTLTAGWTGTLAVSRGGSGTSTLTSHGVLVGAGTGTIVQLAEAGSGTVLTGVASSNPAFTATPLLGVVGATLGQISFAGNTSGSVTIQPQAAAGSYNFNLPITAGVSGLPLLSGGGGAAAMTFGTLTVAAGGTGTGTWATNTVILGGATATGTFQQVTHGSSGTLLMSQGAGVLPIWATVAGASAVTPTVQRFTAAGTATYTAPGTMTYCMVRVKGGGGGGGGSASTTSFGGGGGEGGTGWKIIAKASLTGGSTATVTVGAGGTNVALNTDGTGGTGVTSSFGASVTGTGGIGGGPASTGGNGGSGGGFTGDFGEPGARGGPGCSFNSGGASVANIAGGGGGRGGGAYTSSPTANSGGGGGNGSSGVASSAGATGDVVVIEFYN